VLFDLMRLKKPSVRMAPWLLVLATLVAMPLCALANEAVVKRHAVVKKKHGTKASRLRASRVEAARPSYGELYGLHRSGDPLELKSGVALVLDQDTNEILVSKNPQTVLPIASITKLMTGLVVSEAKQPLDEMLTISSEDVDMEKGSRSRLRVGTRLSREEMLHLALMASENRAANALGRNYPGGLQPFVEAMNRKAQALGMKDTHYVEPTGLSSRNQSSANDLAVLVREAEKHPLIRQFTTSHDHQVALGARNVQFRNTNGLVRSGEWDIGLQKTGYITEAGRCLVMQAQLSGRKLIMVLLDSAGKYSRIGDAERIRKWVSELPAVQHAPAAVAPQA
jgi:serine-type D-Ala-D-Ala endopeptidase (penicillin-binding protein 7)